MSDEPIEQLDVQVEPPVIDETERDETVAPVQYEITSFGADYDTEGLVKRLKRADVFIPPFQRDYVWTQREASRFVESLLLGLPVPGVFLARESQSKKLLVIDGQQRLRTLQFFFEGYFNPDPERPSRRVFKLTGVLPQYQGLTYDTLNKNDRVLLNDAIIHATIVKQDIPEGEQSSIYHIFERLNTSGRRLTPHQIRVAIYHGPFIEMIRELNKTSSWRTIFGRRSRTLKDQDLILRFLALYYDIDQYRRPMKEFLNDFIERTSARGSPSREECQTVFSNTIDFVVQNVGEKAFRPERALNAAVFDSIMVGLARRLSEDPKPLPDVVAKQYSELLSDQEYLHLVSSATSDEKNVRARIALSASRFESL